MKYFLLCFKYRYRIYEPSFTQGIPANTLIVFNKIPHWDDYFKDIKEYRDLIKENLFRIIDPECTSYLEHSASPVIGVHIRMGDFNKLLPGQQFKETGGVRTPLEYFISLIYQIRSISLKLLPVTVFTDGKENEISELIQLENIEIAKTPNEITDLLLLSRSRIIITSAGSTFGYWAGFLSNAMLIMHPDHFHSHLRPAIINENFYEGIFTKDNPLIIKYIQNI